MCDSFTSTRAPLLSRWMSRPGIPTLAVLLILLSSSGHVAAGVIVANNSVATTCAEEDNVNIPLFGRVTAFTIEAVHPGYPVTTYSCPSDFTACDPAVGQDFPFTPSSRKMYDDGTWVLWAYRLSGFWLPQGMAVQVKGRTDIFNDAHYIAVSRKVVNQASWPQFLVLYTDGNLRLIPHPPHGQLSVCFGASIIVGPAEPNERPWCQISRVEFDAAKKALSVSYKGGGTAELSLDVTREAATVQVTVDYPTDFLPFVTFRSMFVREDNCDTTRVRVGRQGRPAGEYDVLDPFVCIGDEFVFERTVPSVHNTSAPDIIVRVPDPNTPAL